MKRETGEQKVKQMTLTLQYEKETEYPGVKQRDKQAQNIIYCEQVAINEKATVNVAAINCIAVVKISK